MKTSILLKLEYLLDNFESINNFTLVSKISRLNNDYLVIIHANTKYFSKEELDKSLKEYFEDTPIEYSIIIDEGKLPLIFLQVIKWLKEKLQNLL